MVRATYIKCGLFIYIYCHAKEKQKNNSKMRNAMGEKISAL